jgi:hypothetical protein
MLQAKAAAKKPIVKQKENRVADFESEMDSELDKLIERETKAYSGYLSKTATESPLVSKPSKEQRSEEADEEDTDSETELETGSLDVRSTKKRAHFTNDELFYDPDMDQKDEDWLNKQRATCRKIKMQKQASVEATKASTSSTANELNEAHIASYSDARTDAILNCPCCMTLLCHDCQRFLFFGW